MVYLENVCKSYSHDGVLAVDHLNLELKAGEIFGFIGSNGAGKTTTIKMMTGILEPDQGKIEIFGHDIQKDTIAAKRCIGYVPDNHEVYERLKGIEYLNFMGDVYNVDPATRNQRMAELLEMFDLTDAINDQIKNYSHGMKQKICVIGALLSSPPLWILDEPMTGLDPQSSYRLKQAMRQHCDEGNIVFFSTHVLEVAQQLCDRVGIIKDGRLVAVGTMDELTKKKGEIGQESLEEMFLSLVGETE